LLYFHRALVKRKYRLLYSPRKRRRPGPKGPSRELIDTVVEMKRRNPRFGCRKIAEQISSAFDVEINRCHTGLAGATPAQRSGALPHTIAKVESYSWQRHCHGLFETPIAA
jgi:hypothetical protein